MLHVIVKPAEFSSIELEWNCFVNEAAEGASFSPYSMFLESWQKISTERNSYLNVIEIKAKGKHFGYLPFVLEIENDGFSHRRRLRILASGTPGTQINLPIAWQEIESDPEVAMLLGETIGAIEWDEILLDTIQKDNATIVRKWIRLAKTSMASAPPTVIFPHPESEIDVHHTNLDRSKKTMILTVGHFFGVILGIVAPMILSRHFPVDDFGIYRQFLAITWLLGLTAHFGMDSGLFYFVKRDPSKAAMYSMNASVFNLCAASLIGLGIVVFAQNIGNLLNVPEIAAEMPYIAAYLVAVLPGQHLPFYLLIRNRIGNATIFAIVNASANAVAAIVGCLYFGTVRAVIVGMTIWAVFKLVWIAYLHGALEIQSYVSEFKKRTHEFQTQIRFGLPLGLATIVTVAAKLDRFIVSAFFGLRVFTGYSIGCFDLPLLPSVIDSISSLMVVDMVKKGDSKKIDDPKKKRVLSIWLSTVSQISVLLIPSVMFSMIFAEPMITTFFSETYSSSAIYFQIYLVSFFLLYIDPDHVFHGLAKTKTSFQINSIGAVFSISFMFIGLFSIGVLGVLVGRIVGEALTSLIRFKVLGHFLSAPLVELLPWKNLSLVFIASAMSGLASITIFNQIHELHVSLKLLICSLNFGVFYLLSSLALGTITLHNVTSLLKKKNSKKAPTLEKLNRGTL